MEKKKLLSYSILVRDVVFLKLKKSRLCGHLMLELLLRIVCSEGDDKVVMMMMMMMMMMMQPADHTCLPLLFT